MRIPVMKPAIPSLADVAPYLEEMYLAGKFTNFGPLNSALESRFAELFKVAPEQVVTASSATAAIMGACYVSGSDEFWVPSYTFAATPLAVRGSGASLRFADVSPDNWRVDKPSVSNRAGLVDVLPFGAKVELESRRLVKNLVVDAAASLGSLGSNGVELEPGWAVIFSLHATKVFGIGEGAVAVFGSPEGASKFRRWTNFGFSETRISMDIGTNAKLSEVSAAFGLAVLDGWGKEFEDWEIANRNGTTVGLALGLDVSSQIQTGLSPYWIVQFESELALTHAAAVLSASDIESRKWWPCGCHRMQAFNQHRGESFPVTDHLASTVLGLPMFRGMTVVEADAVRKCLESAV